MKRIAVLGFALVFSLGCGFAAPTEQAKDEKKPAEEKTGPKVGDKAVEFKLKDQAGDEKELKALLKDGPVALVFFRSASW